MMLSRTTKMNDSDTATYSVLKVVRKPVSAHCDMFREEQVNEARFRARLHVEAPKEWDGHCGAQVSSGGRRG